MYNKPSINKNNIDNIRNKINKLSGEYTDYKVKIRYEINSFKATLNLMKTTVINQLDK